MLAAGCAVQRPGLRVNVGGGVAVWRCGVAYLLIQAVTHFAPLHQDTAGSLNLVGECGGGDTLVTSYNPPHTSGRERGKTSGK